MRTLASVLTRMRPRMPCCCHQSGKMVHHRRPKVLSWNAVATYFQYFCGGIVEHVEALGPHSHSRINLTRCIYLHIIYAQGTLHSVLM